jgi:hypothetical protein
MNDKVKMYKNILTNRILQNESNIEDLARANRKATGKPDTGPSKRAAALARLKSEIEAAKNKEEQKDKK